MIVGIGELLWDVYPDGRKVAGGAPFNFAFHCQQLGHEAAIVSRVGDDELGRELREEVKRLGISDEFIQTDRDHPTGTVRVTVDDGGQPSYEIVEDVAWDYIEWGPSLDLLKLRAIALCFGTLASRHPITRETVEQIISPWTRGADPKVIVCDINLRQTGPNSDFISSAIGGSDWVKLNEGELKAITEPSRMWSGAIEPTIDHFFSNHVVIVTRGSKGCIVSHNGEHFHEPPVPARVVDTVGAGDAFTAAMVCLHLEGRSLQECARFANHYAARVCEHQGGTPRIDRADVERSMT